MARCGAAFGAHKPVLHRNIICIVLIILILVKHETRGRHLRQRAALPPTDDLQPKSAAEDIAFLDRRQSAARSGQPAGTGQLLVEFRLFSLSEPVR